MKTAPDYASSGMLVPTCEPREIGQHHSPRLPLQLGLAVGRSLGAADDHPPWQHSAYSWFALYASANTVSNTQLVIALANTPARTLTLTADKLAWSTSDGALDGADRQLLPCTTRPRV